MRILPVFIFTLLLSSPLQALIVDDTGHAIEITYRDGYYYFSKCTFAGEPPKLSACRTLNAEGLRQHDFERLRQRLQVKAERAEKSAALMRKIEWGVVAVTALTVLLTVSKLHREKILRLFGTADHHHHHHHHHHGIWERISAYFPRFDAAAGGRFFFKEQQWRLPTFIAQLMAIIAVDQKGRADLDKRAVYEFLRTEVLHLSTGAPGNVHVRSLTAVEFMIYEVMRLAEVEEQVADR